MASNKTRNEPEATFTFAVRELRQAGRAQRVSEGAPLKATSEHRGFDPYNTSGSLDHKRNWIRAGKR
jgi:hypothetical protein